MSEQGANVSWHHRLAAIICRHHFRGNSLRSNNVSRRVTNKFQLQKRRRESRIIRNEIKSCFSVF